jgi:tetratricopeptide (TPR) repeat protein
MTSATEAYRQDWTGNSGQFGPSDGDWILVASLLEHSSYAARGDAERLLLRANNVATRTIGRAETKRLSMLEWHEQPTKLDAIILLTSAVQESGALTLAGVMLDCALSVADQFTLLQQGRLEAERARVTYKRGQCDLATERFCAVEHHGHRIRSRELRLRSAIGLASIAQLRGNYPEMLAIARRAAKLARKVELPRLRRRAHYAVVVSAAHLGHHDEGLVHAWHMVNASQGDALEQATSLVDVGQFLLLLGQPDAAHEAFTRVVGRRLPSRVLLPALGGLAVSSARLQEPVAQRVHWAAREIERFRRSAAPPFALASALLECATALRDAGATERAESLRREALTMAERFGYNEIIVEADAWQATSQSTLPKRLVGTAGEVVRYFSRNRVRRLPLHVKSTGDPLVEA